MALLLCDHVVNLRRTSTQKLRRHMGSGQQTNDAVYQGAGNDLPHHVRSEGNNLHLHLPANSVQWYAFRG